MGSQYSHTTSGRSVSSITNADAHTSAASSRLNRLPRRFKWTRPFRRKTKSGFCACAIRFRTSSTENVRTSIHSSRSVFLSRRKVCWSVPPAIAVQCYVQRAAGFLRIVAAGCSLRNPHGKKSGGIGLGVMAAKDHAAQYDHTSPTVLQPPVQFILFQQSKHSDNSPQ